MLSTDDRVQAFRSFIIDVFELAGVARRTSDEMAREIGQTAARWQVMSVVASTRTTVAGVARRLGLRRQGVRRIVNELATAGLIAFQANPDHARSPLVALTEDGRQVLKELFHISEPKRLEFIERSGLSEEDFRTAQRVIGALNRAFHSP